MVKCFRMYREDVERVLFWKSKDWTHSLERDTALTEQIYRPCPTRDGIAIHFTWNLIAPRELRFYSGVNQGLHLIDQPGRWCSLSRRYSRIPLPILLYTNGSRNGKRT